MGLSESNALGFIKPDTQKAKIDVHLEQQRRKTETSPTGGSTAGATTPATILIKSVCQKGPVSQDAWKEPSRTPTAFSEAPQGVAGADTGKEGYLNESATSVRHWGRCCRYWQGGVSERVSDVSESCLTRTKNLKKNSVLNTSLTHLPHPHSSDKKELW